MSVRKVKIGGVEYLLSDGLQLTLPEAPKYVTPDKPRMIEGNAACEARAAMLKKEAAPAAKEGAEEQKPKCAPGSAGSLKLYDTPPAEAAMVMALTAEMTGLPLNELRFFSIREVKDQAV